jgi:excisionase family DNA binding protein
MEKLIGIDEVSEMLGISKATVYSWTSQNKIPHIKLSTRLLKFREQEITDWIAQKSVGTDTDKVGDEKQHKRCKTGFDPNDEDVEEIINDAKNEVLRR